MAHGRVAVGRFDDPASIQLLRDDERAGVERARVGDAPTGMAQRMEFEMLRASAEVMVPRTLAIDDAIGERANRQVVILGAGLDARAWRMRELTDVDVFEVDHPASQLDKRERLRRLEPVASSVRFVPVDFSAGEIGRALDEAGHRGEDPTTWVCEGVVPYLTPAEVEATLRVVASRSAPRSRLIVNYQSPSLRATVGRWVARAVSFVGRQDDPLRGEPRRSEWTPESMGALLARHGFDLVRDDDLVTVAQRLPMSVQHVRSVGAGRVAVADHV